MYFRACQDVTKVQGKNLHIYGGSRDWHEQVLSIHWLAARAISHLPERIQLSSPYHTQLEREKHAEQGRVKSVPYEALP